MAAYGANILQFRMSAGSSILKLISLHCEPYQQIGKGATLFQSILPACLTIPTKIGFNS